jgi:SH3-like domain-containing protein
LLVSLLLIPSTLAHAQMVSIARSKVDLRDGPGRNHVVLWELGRGFPLQVIDRKGDWLRVMDFENDSGWVLAKLVNKQPHVVVKKERSNIRSGPGSTHKIVGRSAYGEALRTLQHGKGWVRVEHDNGIVGWVRKDLVWGW